MERVYSRLVRWGWRLQLPMQSCDTPLERGQVLAKAWPHLAEEIDTVCLAYVRQQYGAPVPGSVQMRAEDQAERAWRRFQGPIWRRWLGQSLRNLNPKRHPANSRSEDLEG